ncbi:matrixin family metalloprotease [Chengkuizengella sp. SCS-71B]|uniref:matrixin family metalloprotease n=1 Tax=Chengkuizengella sp. SCS-71B TaxID=3115290 RepID=UPI0032C24345
MPTTHFKYRYYDKKKKGIIKYAFHRNVTDDQKKIWNGAINAWEDSLNLLEFNGLKFEKVKITKANLILNVENSKIEGTFFTETQVEYDDYKIKESYASFFFDEDTEEERLILVAMQAIGHAMGLDSSNTRSVMYPVAYSAGNEFELSKPTYEDLKAVVELYSAKPGESGGIGGRNGIQYSHLKYKDDTQNYYTPDIFDAADVAFTGKVIEKPHIRKDDDNHWMGYRIRVDQKFKGKLADPHEVEIHQSGSDEGGDISTDNNLRYLQTGDTIIFMGNYRDNGTLSAVNEGDGLFVQHQVSDRYSSSLKNSPLSKIHFTFEQLVPKLYL